MLEGLRLAAAALCLVAGVIILIVATIGVFRFHFCLLYTSPSPRDS